MMRDLQDWINSVLPIRPGTATRRGQWRLHVEQMDERVTPTVSLTPSLSGGDLVIADMDATGKNNSLTAVVSGTTIIITDAAEQFSGAGGIAGASLSNGERTLTVPVASISGNLVVNS